jgi:ribosomal protein S27E
MPLTETTIFIQMLVIIPLVLCSDILLSGSGGTAGFLEELPRTTHKQVAYYS